MICGAPVLAMQVPKVRQPHPDIGCWWTLYDYGLDKVKTWDKDYEHPYPGYGCFCGTIMCIVTSPGCCASLVQRSRRSMGDLATSLPSKL